MRLQADGLTRFAIWPDPLHARLLIVTDPELLALTRPSSEVGLSADRMVIVAGHPPMAPQGRSLAYDPASVERNATRMFQTAPDWLPAHADIAVDLAAHGATRPALPPRQLQSRAGRVATAVHRTAGWFTPDCRVHRAGVGAPGPSDTGRAAAHATPG